MDNLPQYNLIQAIDPTKVKIPISDRFSKLTLSSNKKQRDKNKQVLEEEDQQPVDNQEKRLSISRNLLQQLSLVDEDKKSTQDDKTSSEENKTETNPLLRSESSKETDNNNCMTLEDKNETMEPLNVTDDESNTQLQLDEDLEALSQRIATMAVVSRPISISSESTEHLYEITELQSTESERSSLNDANGPHIVRNIPINMSLAAKRNTIFLNSSEDVHRNQEESSDISDEEEKENNGEEKEGEINDEKEEDRNEKRKNNEEDDKNDESDSNEDDEDEDDDDEAITISDTTESHDIEPDEMITSTIPSTTQTSENLELPCLPDNVAERVAAFLRDVSIERRVMEEQGHIDYNDTVDRILDNAEIDQIQESLAKSKQIATADTESMTPDVDEEFTPKSLLEREKRLKALDESRENIDNLEIEKDSNHNSSKNNNSKHLSETPKTNIHRLANDETCDNTLMTEDEECSLTEKNKTPKMPTNLKSLNRGENTPSNPRRLANDETEVNSEFSLTEAFNTPKIKTNFNSSNRYNSPSRNNSPNPKSSNRFNSPNRQQNPHRLTNEETENNTELNKTPKVPTLSNRYNSPKFHQNINNDPYRLANAETEANTLLSSTEINKTPKNKPNSLNHYNTPHQQENAIKDHRRLAFNETELNSEFPQTEINKTPKTRANLNSSNQYKSPKLQENKENAHLRLANNETIENSLISEIHSKLNLSIPYDYSKDLKTPEKSAHAWANNQTRENSPLSIVSSPEVLSDSINHENSHTSIINSSSEHNATIPEHSITILETDDESVVSNKSSLQTSYTDENKKLSNSLQNGDTPPSSSDEDIEEQVSKIQMSMASINISAKINIKIQISSTTSTETSEDDQNDGPEVPKPNKRNIESNQMTAPQSNDEILKSCNQLQLRKPAPEQFLSPAKDSSHSSEEVKDQSKSPHDKSTSSLEKSSDSVEIVEDEKFFTEAQKLLNQLYGKSWQTPDVMRTLKRSSASGGDTKSNKSNTSTTKKKQTAKTTKADKSTNKSAVEESILDDFSMFRRNIVKTNLDSTRLATPKGLSRLTKNKEILTEPRNPAKKTLRKEYIQPSAPQTERKSKQTPVAKIVINKGRVDNGRWRNLIDNDSDSEGNNASDDDDADKSWSKEASEIEDDCDSDSDFDLPKPKTRNRARRNKTPTDNLTRQLNKSKSGDIVYLDLSKEEVEVQEEVAASPPANHDETFASRLENILKTCRHEDKAKLPSSATKTKRKLFTPNFGDDDLEGLQPNENEMVKEIIAKVNDNNLDDILEDIDNCPFDSHGRPKILDLVNKQLESVKTGKPIFQLTPSPKKQKPPLTDKNEKAIKTATPKSKTNNKDQFKTPSTNTKEKFKTPVTVKAKGPPTALQDLCQTPDYKYSFLKSLDVTVSKSFCHPDALYYRENYRTKKEDLSKILYDLYIEKLFQNKMDVPVTWNKKLTNTAGRCLNRKRLGTRTSAIELSDKVLTSGDRLRCTLIHELCHAATWIFSGEGGHGSTWKEWARKANATFPEIPKIGVCHQYDIEYKYTYKCTLCSAKSHAHSKSKKVENIRCSYCHGAIEIFLNKKDKDGNIMPTPVREPTGFAKFVKDNYKKFKRDDLKHADVMKLLSGEFASLKVTTNAN